MASEITINNAAVEAVTEGHNDNYNYDYKDYVIGSVDMIPTHFIRIPTNAMDIRAMEYRGGGIVDEFDIVWIEVDANKKSKLFDIYVSARELLAQKNDNLSSEVDKLKAEIKALKEERNIAQRNVTINQEVIDDRDAEIEKLVSGIDRLSSEVIRLKAKLYDLSERGGVA